MKKKVHISGLAVVLLVVFLWVSGIIPKQIAKIHGTNYVQECFPEMDLEYKGIEWNSYYGDYIITFQDKEDKTYGCIIYPKMFPICLGQGMVALEEAYRGNYGE